jgi:two-component system cell cycle response regulator
MVMVAADTHVLARRPVRRAAFATLAALLAAYMAGVATGHGAEGVTNLMYYALLVSGALICLARAAAVPSDRLAWTLIGLGLAAWAAADIAWTLFFADLESPPYPSPCDAGWLSVYPCSYAGLMLLLRSRRRSLPAGLWLDGGIAALGASALVAALVLEPVLAGAVEGASAAVATSIAYPVGDLLFLAIVIWAFASTGWRPDRQWLLLGAGMVASGAADTLYLLGVAHDTYVEGGFIDSIWPISALLMGWAAWQPPDRAALRLGGLRVVLVPAAFALVAIGLLVWDHVHRLSDLAIALSAATLLVGVVRMGVTFLANLRMLEASRHDAVTDALTGLGNRRALMAHLDAATSRESLLLALFDLDGFKRYNDTYGHPAGDALLKRLGSRLAAAVAPDGTAYRMGGDEFCVLLDGARQEEIVEAAAAALRESGEGFSIAASQGTVRPGRDVATAAEALQVADQRMYGHKLERAAGRSNDARDVLMRILHEREPDLHDHITSVAELAVAVGMRLGLAPEANGELARAAELHDIGKMAIPDTILGKPGPLDEDEWAFMRRHTLIGEAILSAAPALVPVARIVRSSHERFDGTGYPDGLAGEDIPVAARIVAICDAYDAMTSHRSYRRGMSSEAAVEELRRNAGTQFDPRMVKVFCAVLAQRLSGERPLGGSAAHAAAPTSSG